jgi:crossover junction endodeoxyribonuclease RuvC
MPGQGVASTFKFGQSYGSVLGLFGALKYNIIDVTPRRWKKDLSLTSDKEQARQMAINNWPDVSDLFKRKKDHGRAEAALIALWYLNYYE